MGEDGFIIFGAKSCLILRNNSMPPRQLTYIFDPAGNRVNKAHKMLLEGAKITETSWR